jgi:hypothetical protein
VLTLLILLTASSNSIYLNGHFRFNIGDEVWIIDDNTGGLYSPLGSNNNPSKYRIDKVVLSDMLGTQSIDNTQIYLNYNLSNQFGSTGPTQSNLNYETGLRVVSHFKDSRWKSGLWTNGIFQGGNFEQGIWYNGIFSGTWGN